MKVTVGVKTVRKEGASVGNFVSIIISLMSRSCDSSMWVKEMNCLVLENKHHHVNLSNILRLLTSTTRYVSPTRVSYSEKFEIKEQFSCSTDACIVRFNQIM